MNAALFEAPAGARIQIVAESRNNGGVNDARFEYAGTILAREAIQNLPGCTFNVGEETGQLQAVVAFSDTASGTARYDLAEIENGAKLNLGKFTLKADGSPFISFAIEPITVAARAAVKPAARRHIRKKTAKKKAAKKKKTSRKKAASRRPSRKRR